MKGKNNIELESQGYYGKSNSNNIINPHPQVKMCAAIIATLGKSLGGSFRHCNIATSTRR